MHPGMKIEEDEDEKEEETVTQALFGQRYPVPLKYFKIVLLMLWDSSPKGANDL